MKKKTTGLMSAFSVVSNKSDVEHTASGKRGKKSDPAYTQMCVLVEKEPYNELRRRVIGMDRDASDIINALLKGWVSGEFEV
jgi:hypothetical protein